jgi:hypothetical protein
MLIWFTIAKSDRKTDRKVMQVNNRKADTQIDGWAAGRWMDGWRDRQMGI